MSLVYGFVQSEWNILMEYIHTIFCIIGEICFIKFLIYSLKKDRTRDHCFIIIYFSVN